MFAWALAVWTNIDAGAGAAATAPRKALCEQIKQLELQAANTERADKHDVRHQWLVDNCSYKSRVAVGVRSKTKRR